MLADFHPKGAMADTYGVYLGDKGLTDRATVIINTEGKVCHASSAGLPGLRNAADLIAECKKVNG